MNQSSVSYEIVRTQGDAVYLAAEFVKQYSDMDYQFYEDPDRVTVQYDWKDYLYADVRRATQMRTEPSIKSPILREMETGEKLLYVDAATEQEQNGFVKVMTSDGIIGYVQTRALTDSYYETLESDFEAPVYTSIQRDYTINLVWHQVTNESANDHVMSLLENTTGITAISPTWFRIASEDGTLSSLASETYVARMREEGIEVWALVDNFHPDVDTHEVLSYTSRRERLVNEIIAAAIPTLQAGGVQIQGNADFPKRRITPLDRLKSGLVNWSFYRFFVTAHPFYAKECCTGCGHCVQVCPLNNIRLQDGRPVWGRQCTHCMACICGCPTQAIEYGKKSQGKPRYQCPPYMEAP